MKRWAAAAPILIVASTGCLASKSDIRLLQDELRVNRSQLVTVDSSVLRANDQRARQIAALSANIDRMNDTLRALAARFAAFQATANGEFDSMGRQMVAMQSLLGQTTRNVQDTRARLEALQEQGTAAMSATPSPSAAAPAGGPGAATLFTTGKEQLDNGAYGTARGAFEQLLTTYPNSAEAPRAQLYIAISYASDRNTAAADSVYQVVYTKYPKSPEAATALYKHGIYLWDANKKADARLALNKVQRDYPDSDEARSARDFLRERDR